ncbi:MAG TPA: M12 family metallo-peptidase, partial [Roseiflexaceae bacterium]|nr:M12 family metallo-peptidase [Roseiflexaceae bacterium]
MLITFLISASIGLMQNPASRASISPVPQAESSEREVAADARRPTVAALAFAGFNDRGEARLSVDRDAVRRLQEQGEAIVHVGLPHGEVLTLDLDRFEVIAPDARIRIAGKAGESAGATPNIVFLRGRVAGEPQSHAYLALNADDPSKGLGTIQRQTGEQWHIGSDRSGQAPSMLIRRGAGNLPDFDHFCSMIPLDAVAGGAGGDGGLAGSAFAESAGPRVLNVAVDSDQRYWNLFGDDQDAIDYIAMVIGAVSDIYIRDLNMRIALRLTRIWPAGGEPFIASSLSGFRDHWQENEDMDGINLVHMFSGARDTSYGGVAYLTNACTGNGFGISAFLLGGFDSPIGPPNLGNWDVVVVAHEMGHNLGTPHTHDLDPPIDSCATGTLARGTIMSYCHTLQGGLLNTDMHMHRVIEDIIIAANPVTPENCLWHDCNGNLINDVEDIVFATSLDANSDGIPDE